MRGRLSSLVKVFNKAYQKLSKRKNKKKRYFSIKDVLFPLSLKRVILLALFFGIIFRIVVTINYNPGYDASYYITLGRGYSQMGKPYLPFGDIETDSLNPTCSTSTRQLFPFYLGIFYFMMGFSYITTKVAVTFLSALTLITVYYTTKNLYGKKNAFVVTGMVSLINVLIYTTGVVYTENLTYILLTIGLWGVIKGDKYLPLGMVSLGAFFISRCYSFILFVLMVAGFFCWLYLIKKDKLWNRYNFIAIVSMVPFAIALYLFNLQSNYPVNRIGLFEAILTNPWFLLSHYFYYLFFALIYVLIFAMYFLRPLERSFSIKNPLWMAIIAMTMGIPLAMAYQDYIYNIYSNTPKEGLRAIFYVTLPILWLSIPKIELYLNEKIYMGDLKSYLENPKVIFKDHRSLVLSTGAIASTLLFMPHKWLLFPLGMGMVSLFFMLSKMKITILCMMLFIVNLNDNTGVGYSYNRELGEDMNEIIEDNDVVMLDGIDYMKAHNNSQFDRYILSPYVTKNYRIINFDSNETPDYIITQNKDAQFDNYRILKTYYSHDKGGIFTQTYNFLYHVFVNPNERERIPMYIVWERDEKQISPAVMR